MTLEASDWLKWCQLAYWRCTCGCISRPTFKLSASLLDIMGKSKEISQERPQKNNCRPPQVWFILRSNFQTPEGTMFICTNNSTQVQIPWDHAQEGDTFCLLEMNVLWCEMQINPRTTVKDLVKMLEETGTKVSISTVKRVLYPHNLKGRSARK